MAEPKFEKGDKIVRISDSQKGIILEVVAKGRGGIIYRVSIGGCEDDIFEIELKPDIDVSDPYERCKQDIYGSYDEYLRINTMFKVENSNANTISSLIASKTLFRPYQYKPLLKFLHSDNHRLLIADEVGLGKTIEAGHIMMELKARNELKNVLIICPKSLQNKWKEEMKERFGLGFTIYEDKKQLIEDLKERNGVFKGIVNYEKIRSSEEEYTFGKKREKRETNDLLNLIIKENKHFGLVVCDEAHRMRNVNNTNRGAAKLLQFAEAVIFLTATPVMLNNENLFQLLKLLDDVTYDSAEIFENNVQLNMPFVKALSSVSDKRKPLKEIAKELENCEVQTLQIINKEVFNSHTHVIKDYFADFPVYKRIITNLNGPDSEAIRARLQYDLSLMSPMNQIFSRTRKKEVTTDWSQAERNPHLCLIELNADELEEYNRVIDDYIDDNSYEDDWGDTRMTQGGSLGLVQKKRQVASSTYGYLNTVEDLDKGIDRYCDLPDAKLEELVRVAETVFKNGEKKLIVFVLFKKTLKYLAIRLRELGYECAAIHGDVEDRSTELERFRDDPKVNILLSTEVGSEGLDMQFCSSMVNFDLPWNPMVVEQRIGRIDRFGQQAEKVNIYNFVVKDSIQEDIYKRLLDRIGIFRGTIGDMEAILDSRVEREGRKDMTISEMYRNMEKEFFCNKLSKEERQKKIDEIAQAFENQNQLLGELQEGLSNTMTNDAFFRDEISRIKDKSKAYVTEAELHNFLVKVFEECLPTCELIDKGNKVYEFVLPLKQPKALVSFLESNRPVGEEVEKQFHQFRAEIEGKKSLLLTFDQETACENRHLIYINIYNPIVIAALGYFKSKQSTNQMTFRFEIPKESTDVAPHLYVLAQYVVTVSKEINNKKTSQEQLCPVLYDLTEMRILEDEDQVSGFIGAVQTDGFHSLEERDMKIADDQLTIVRSELASSIVHIKNAMKAKIKEEDENKRKREIKQLKESMAAKLERRNQIIERLERELEAAEYIGDSKTVTEKAGVINLQTKNRDDEQFKMEEKLSLLETEPIIHINGTMKMLNLIKVV